MCVNLTSHIFFYSTYAISPLFRHVLQGRDWWFVTVRQLPRNRRRRICDFWIGADEEEHHDDIAHGVPLQLTRRVLVNCCCRKISTSKSVDGNLCDVHRCKNVVRSVEHYYCQLCLNDYCYNCVTGLKENSNRTHNHFAHGMHVNGIWFYVGSTSIQFYNTVRIWIHLGWFRFQLHPIIIWNNIIK